MSIAAIDIVFISLILIASLRGAFIGMIAELISIAALFISLLLAAVFYPDGAEWINSHSSSLENFACIIAFAGIFLVSYILFKLLQKGVVHMIDESRFESVDKLLGFFFGILEGLLLCFLIVYILNFQTFFDISKILKGSELVPYIERFLPSLDTATHNMEELLPSLDKSSKKVLKQLNN
ncbi:MAG: hypothetical protein B6241_06520 [Spirochaetaceae bacterium 4572_59]|nr:MAG: hypothetical protein B6241_06520 [Spirochaetaceae bacterium 4572_59]